MGGEGPVGRPVEKGLCLSTCVMSGFVVVDVVVGRMSPLWRLAKGIKGDRHRGKSMPTWTVQGGIHSPVQSAHTIILLAQWVGIGSNAGGRGDKWFTLSGFDRRNAPRASMTLGYGPETVTLYW